MIGLLVAGTLCCGGADEDWHAVWSGLSVLEALSTEEGPTRAMESLRLESLAAARTDPLRKAVLHFHLERLAGGRPAPVAPPRRLVLSPGEAWPMARALAPGEAADAALLAAVGEVCDGPALARCLVLGYERFQALSEVFRADDALRLGEALHERARAPWSAGNLGRILGRLGRAGEGRAVLSEQLAREGDPAVRLALYDDRGLLALGAGEWELARADLGLALVQGSPSAAVVLGQRALAHGRSLRARALFREGARAVPPRPWALRGWGLSMLAGQETGLPDPLTTVTDPSSRDR
ncbi:MAG: hypothetical protein CMJ84_08355 [Planctomycetes bacterium]|nr:hypothetical protein [Planctomycetota bacterium]MDP6409522.1 hypothetical protein [Planctomycetota bacterium]